MNPETIYHAISTLLTLLIGVWLLLWRYRSYCVDLFRQRVFELRARLFDEADAGLIPFDHPAYGILRTGMNGHIRFAHRLNMWFVLLAVFLTWKDITKEEVTADPDWEKATEPLDMEIRTRLNVFRSELNNLAMRHVLLGSPEIYIAFPPLLLFPIVLLNRAKIKEWADAASAVPPNVKDSSTNSVSRVQFASANVLHTINNTAKIYGKPSMAA